MKRNVWVIVGIGIVVVAVVAFFLLRHGRESMVVDLVDAFPQAERHPATPDVFKIIDASLGGNAKHSIFVTQPSRLEWKETIPDNAWLAVSVGLQEEAWTKPGDGVLFRVGVSYNTTYDELLNQVMDPYGNTADRHWQDVMLDLSPYAGQTVKIILATNAGPAGKDDRANDLAVWGHPRIITR